MLLEWLIPVIEERCEDINDELLKEKKDNHYNNLIDLINGIEGLDSEQRIELENLFLLHCRQAIEHSYKCGLREGISIFRAI
ncbi:hypothetical protein ACQKLN_29660 [Paenibacillus glucanolyticus]|uniref:hypothetical protein n=1 Tax=Paenibacillus glucanolyticus TaxID=59843 RepID=UPI0036BB7A82